MWQQQPKAKGRRSRSLYKRSKILLTSPYSGVQTTDDDQILNSRNELETLVFNQMLISNALKNLILQQPNSQSLQPVINAMSSLTSETAKFLDDRKLEITHSHLNLIAEADVAFN